MGQVIELPKSRKRWSARDARNLGIRSHGIDLVCLDYADLNNVGMDILPDT